MKLHEHKAKEIFSEYGIQIPEGMLITQHTALDEITFPMKFPVAIKAQVLVGGRGKADGIVFADNANEARDKINNMLGMSLKGEKVRTVLVEEKLPLELEGASEFYAGFTIDRNIKLPVLILSAEGGVEIEEFARARPEGIIKHEIDPFKGLQTFHIRNCLKKLGLAGRLMVEVASVVHKLYRVFRDYDAELAEINPLYVAPHQIVALDAVLNIDDNALFRHKELLKTLPESEEYTELEKKAKEHGLSYVELDGDIAIIGCGAGLVMASLDAVHHFGGRPANFLDVGGGANAENMAKALEIVLMKEGVNSIFINIFGGITRCDEIARGIVEVAPEVPLAVRMMGTHEEEGKRILAAAGYEVFDTLEEGAQSAVRLAAERTS